MSNLVRDHKLACVVQERPALGSLLLPQAKRCLRHCVEHVCHGDQAWKLHPASATGQWALCNIEFTVRVGAKISFEGTQRIRSLFEYELAGIAIQ